MYAESVKASSLYVAVSEKHDMSNTVVNTETCKSNSNSKISDNRLKPLNVKRGDAIGKKFRLLRELLFCYSVDCMHRLNLCDVL